MVASATTISRVNGGARPADGSSFGNAQITGRQLTHYTITSAGMFTFGNGTNINYLAAGSDYEKLVAAVAQVGSGNGGSRFWSRKDSFGFRNYAGNV